MGPGKSGWPQRREKQRQGGWQRERLGVVFALVTLAGVGAVMAFGPGLTWLMPGPLTSAHGAIETCNSCHAKVGEGPMSWVHGLVAGDPRGDSKACLTCHKMPETAFNAHGATDTVLKGRTERAMKVANQMPAPFAALAQSVAFPTDDVSADGVNCATCHQEHQGAKFKLGKISNEQCRSCHVVKFDSFDGDHPKFDGYPFQSRTRIIFDHAGHFGKHYQEVAKKDPTKAVPATCATCHTSRDDKRVMAVAPFDKTCAGCHLDQIRGKERASGPKGIAFLALPGLDVATLKKKQVALGEWPAQSEAALTPFLKVMIGQTPRGREVIKAVEGVDLQDLSGASGDQIKAVGDLAWEIKTLFHALIARKAADVLSELRIGDGDPLGPMAVADLTASIPREIIASAQRQWLPNLAREIANGRGASIAQTDGWSTVTEPAVVTRAEGLAPGPDAVADADGQAADLDPPAPEAEPPAPVFREAPVCGLRVLGQCLVYQSPSDAQPPEAAGIEPGSANVKPDAGARSTTLRALPGASRAGLGDIAQTAQLGASDATAGAAIAKAQGNKASQPSKPVLANGGGQSDDLLFPTPEELAEINARNKAAGRAARTLNSVNPEATGSSDSPSASSNELQPIAAQSSSILGAVDPESWADYGGWYQQDHTIFYRPVGHKDKFAYAWLTLTGPHAAAGSASPEASVFQTLTRKDAQGSCVKCHSVDDVAGKGRTVNFKPLTAANKQGRFTRFIHEPHFGTTGNRGCVTCHEVLQGKPYLKSYEQGNPHTFTPEFSAIKQETCQSCHNSTKARQDCLTCHTYHVNDVVTPITQTKLSPP